MCRFTFAAVLVLAATTSSISANVFDMPPGLTSLEMVTVGNAGNAGDTRYGGSYGSVGYTYDIGKYEVTAGQYCEFLNAVARTDTYGLYNTSMWSYTLGCKIQRSGSSGNYTYTVAFDYANRPVNYVSYWDACRFANWLHNNQPTGAQGPGTTETGAYTLNGYDGTDGRTIQRNPDARWTLPTDDEWYKAAYYKGGSMNAGYWDYPTGSNTTPGWDLVDASGNNANYHDYDSGNPFPIQPPYYTTVVGEFQNSASPYGTFDQGGNVFEWDEALAYQDATYAFRGWRGGAFSETDACLRASFSGGRVPSFGDYLNGFRVVEVPEPATFLLLAVGGLAMMRRRESGR